MLLNVFELRLKLMLAAGIVIEMGACTPLLFPQLPPPALLIPPAVPLIIPPPPLPLLPCRDKEALFVLLCPADGEDPERFRLALLAIGVDDPTWLDEPWKCEPGGAPWCTVAEVGSFPVPTVP